VSTAQHPLWIATADGREPDEPMTGAALRGARERLGMTQLALAVELDLDNTTISRYERGKRKITRVVELAVKALELGVRLA
jgi:transcriptional regulator with XRE-family HTH domain